MLAALSRQVPFSSAEVEIRLEGSAMITRIWHGWTTPENATAYEQLLRNEIFAGIAARKLPGYYGISLGRHSSGDEIEFVTIMWFETLDAVRAFAGEDYERAVVPPRARALLKRFDERSEHYETVVPPPFSSEDLLADPVLLGMAPC
jgi:heme-degrading monooxygenase HmoA